MDEPEFSCTLRADSPSISIRLELSLPVYA
jgi:hypothetical protein